MKWMPALIVWRRVDCCGFVTRFLGCLRGGLFSRKQLWTLAMEPEKLQRVQVLAHTGSRGGEGGGVKGQVV